MTSSSCPSAPLLDSSVSSTPLSAALLTSPFVFDVSLDVSTAAFVERQAGYPEVRSTPCSPMTTSTGVELLPSMTSTANASWEESTTALTGQTVRVLWAAMVGLASPLNGVATMFAAWDISRKVDGWAALGNTGWYKIARDGSAW